VVAGNLAAGTGFAFWGVLWATTLQTEVPAAVLSRVAAYDVAGSILALPAGRALAGPAASAFGTRALLTVCTVSALLISGAMLAVPAVRGLRVAVPTPELPFRATASADRERGGRVVGTGPEPDLEPTPAP
jgi:hypothetical protein